MESKRWIGEIDYLRGFAILSVVAIHVIAYFTDIQGINSLAVVNIYFNVFFHYAVPLFIVISGIVLVMKYNIKYNVKKFYIKRFYSVIPQYLFFTAFYLIFISIINNKSYNILYVVYAFLTASAITPMWFIAVIIQFYLLYPFIERIYEWFNKRNKTIQFLIIGFTIQIIYAWLRIGVFTVSENVLIDNMMFRFFPGNLFYFAVGVYIGKNFDRIIKLIVSLDNKKMFTTYLIFTILMSGVYVIGMINYLDYDIIPQYYFIINKFIGPLVYVAFIFALYKFSINLLKTKNIVTNALKYLGHYSFGIYLVHVCILMLVAIGLKEAGITYIDWAFYPIAFIVTVIGSYFIVVVLSYLPGSQYIVGTHNNISKNKGTRPELTYKKPS